jgi:hypothetical protein
MVMFLMALCMSLFGLAVTCLAFAAATREDRPEPAAQPELKPVVALPARPERFFVGSPRPSVPRPTVPIEVLLLQIERHVRLEQAAAESFLDYPTAASLHSRTASPLVH